MNCNYFPTPEDIRNFPLRKLTKCECVNTSQNLDDLREFADPTCPLCDGDGWQKRDKPIIRCKHCSEPIGLNSDDPNYRHLATWMHHPEDGPDAYIDCGDEYGTQAEPEAL
jgi:hypothetical protein